VITHDHDIARSLPRQVAMRDGLIESDVSHDPRHPREMLRDVAR
jgi:hypothetical protein